MVILVRLALALAIAWTAVLATRQVADAHDIHTSVLDLRWDAHNSALSGTLRVFADDLAQGARAAGVAPQAYVLRSVQLRVATGVVPVAWCGERRVADAVLICLRAATAGARPTRIRNTLLLERYEDQVNVVRVESPRAVTLLLTRGDPERAIP